MGNYVLNSACPIALHARKRTKGALLTGQPRNAANCIGDACAIRPSQFAPRVLGKVLLLSVNKGDEMQDLPNGGMSKIFRLRCHQNRPNLWMALKLCPGNICTHLTLRAPGVLS